MVRAAPQPQAQFGGVYAHLLRYYERDHDDWVANVTQSHHDHAPFPRQRILDGLRAGEPVNVPADVLPRAVRAGAPTRKGRLGLATITPARAIVSADDSIRWSDDNVARLWLEENDI